MIYLGTLSINYFSALYHHIMDQMQYANLCPTVGGCFCCNTGSCYLSCSISIVLNLYF